MNDILIVGAGPVGLTLAVCLVQKGVKVRVIEKEESLTKIPKASTIHPASLEIYDELGLLEEIKARGLVADRFQYWNRSSNEIIAEFHLSELKEETKYPYRVQCEQYQLTSICYDYLSKSDLISFEFGTEIIGISKYDQHVVYEVLRNGKISEEKSDFLIACDGASSLVRKSLNINFEGFTYEDPYQLIVMDYDLTKTYENLAPVSYFFDNEWVAVIQSVNGLWKILIPYFNELEDHENYIYERAKAFTKQDGDFNIVHSAKYRAHQRVVETFVKGNVILIGDAAHINTPLGGMGMNSGIHDAYYLAKILSNEGVSTEELNDFNRKRQYIIREFVQKHTIANAKRASGKTQSLKQMEELQHLMEDAEAAKEYMRKTTMLYGMKEMEKLATTETM